MRQGKNDPSGKKHISRVAGAFLASAVMTSSFGLSSCGRKPDPTTIPVETEDTRATESIAQVGTVPAEFEKIISEESIPEKLKTMHTARQRSRRHQMEGSSSHRDITPTTFPAWIRSRRDITRGSSSVMQKEMSYLIQSWILSRSAHLTSASRRTAGTTSSEQIKKKRGTMTSVNRRSPAWFLTDPGNWRSSSLSAEAATIT